MVPNLLNLPQYRVLGLEQDEHDYHIRAEITVPVLSCAYCKSPQVVGFGRREQLIRDLPIHGKRVGIYVQTRRFQCKTCTKTFSESLPAVDDRRLMTGRLVHWMGEQAIHRTFASIAQEIGCTEGTVRQVFSDYSDELQSRYPFETPTWMGIDEIHLQKPRGVITNVKTHTIVELLPNRNKATLLHYLFGLRDLERVELVTIDMWTPYCDAVELAMPKAKIIVDKFHVVRMASDAMEKVRKRIRADLSPRVRRTLMHDRFVLLKREHQLSDEEFLLLDGWCKNYPLLGEAYRLKEGFYRIYDARDEDDAFERYNSWRKSIPTAIYPEFSDLVRAFENWMPYILNYFTLRTTNAYTEALNSLIRVMDRNGRGYSFEVLRAKMLFSEGLHKHTRSRPKFVRKPSTKESLPPQEPVMSFFGMGGMGRSMPTPTGSRSAGSISRSTQTFEPPKNYGTDISTLIDWLEDGRF